VTALRRLLRGKGLQRRAEHFCVVGELALFPEWFAEPIGDDIRHIQFLDFVFHGDDDERNNRLADQFIERHGAPVVFTPGTAVEDITEFCAAISETCRLLDAPAIVLSRYVADQLDKFDFAASGATVLALDHVDLGYLLPKARLLVHHGGIGTLAQAVRAGIPQIIRPRMYDQPMNAIRVALNGVGGMLYNDAYSGREIAEVYRFIEASELHRERLEYYGNLVRAGNGARQAAELIVRHAATATARGRHEAPLEAIPAGAAE
jgi:UDP:flavonoid glycosyltransferase YjiC (YdhE family)